jgi:hypothetical protein
MNTNKDPYEEFGEEHLVTQEYTFYMLNEIIKKLKQSQTGPSIVKDFRKFNKSLTDEELLFINGQENARDIFCRPLNISREYFERKIEESEDNWFSSGKKIVLSVFGKN